MKKTLATLLVLAMVASVLCMMFVVPAAAAVSGEGNLAAGKTWSGDTEIGTSYVGELTDGLFDPEGHYDESIWYGADRRKTEDDAFTMIFDLEETYNNIEEVKAFVWPAGYSGIVVPASIDVYGSVDGEEYFELGSIDAFDGTDPQWISFAFETYATARYIRIDMVASVEGDTGVFWFVGEVEVNAGEVVVTEPAKTWEDTFVVNDKEMDDGSIEHEAAVEVPYGYTWTIDDINGTIGGEDATICTTQDAFNACNPNWAITLYLEKQADGTYVAIQDAIVCPGSATNAGIAVDEDHIAVVIHSATSDPNRESEYANWQAKIVAVSVKAGDVFEVDMDGLTVYSVIPAAEVVPPVSGGNDEAREELIAELEALVGEAIDDPAYTWNLEVALDEETGNVIVTATLSGVDAAQLQCIEGTLHYDADVLTLLTTADKENALLCLTEPAGSEGEWENMSTLVEDGEIRLGATTFGSATLSDEDPMIFTLEFALAEGTTLTGLYIDTPETYGMNVDADVVNGNGAYGILEIVEEEEPTPSEDESKPSTGAGDAGILVFAILGILAVAGATVVIKVRN